jgi:hypothetical protein
MLNSSPKGVKLIVKYFVNLDDCLIFLFLIQYFSEIKDFGMSVKKFTLFLPR